MNQLLYKNFEYDDLTLNDHLAIERTSLANERTLLAYVRTMIGMAAVGGTLIKFFTDRLIIFGGWVFLLLGFLILIIGFTRYLRIYTYIQKIEKSEVKTSLKNDPLQYLLWLIIKKLHIAPSKAD